MARQTNQQPQNRRPARNQGSAADFTQKKQAPPKRQTQSPKPKQRELPESTPGEVLWKLALILCTGMVIAALLFASINGGSQYVGLPEQDTNATPTPPIVSVDPALNVTGSDQTPIPPSPTPEGDAATGDTAGGDATTVTP